MPAHSKPPRRHGSTSASWLGLRTADTPIWATDSACDGFESWGGIRGVVQALAFVCNISSLVVLRPLL